MWWYSRVPYRNHLLGIKRYSRYDSTYERIIVGILPKYHMFWNIWNLFWREAWKKQWSCSDDSKYRAFILGQSEQQFKIQDHFGILYPIIGEGKWYDDAASQDLKFICELSGNIWFLYSMKSILDIYKILVDAELIYNLSSLANCDNLHLLIYDWSNMALIHVFHPHVILFLLLVGFIFLVCNS